MQKEEREQLYSKIMEQVYKDFEYLKNENYLYYLRIVGEIEKVYREYILYQENVQDVRPSKRYIDPNGEDDVESK